MPKVSRYFIKSGMIYFLIGIIMHALAELPGYESKIHLMPVYWHMIALGWITQLIIGVSLWMFPRGIISKAPKNGSSIAWFSFICLNLGLIFRFISEPVLQIYKNYVMIPYLLSILFQFLGVLFYVFEIWPRLYIKSGEGKKV